MGILFWITIGVIVSILTLAIEPYVNRIHIPATIILGVAGAVLGGVIGSFLGFNTIEGMHFMIPFLAFAGSIFFLTLYRNIEKLH